jgi:hypothetical protein
LSGGVNKEFSFTIDAFSWSYTREILTAGAQALRNWCNGSWVAQASSQKFPVSAIAYDVASKIPGLFGLFMNASFQECMKLQYETSFARNTSLSPNNDLI